MLGIPESRLRVLWGTFWPKCSITVEDQRVLERFRERGFEPKRKARIDGMYSKSNILECTRRRGTAFAILFECQAPGRFSPEWSVFWGRQDGLESCPTNVKCGDL